MRMRFLAGLMITAVLTGALGLRAQTGEETTVKRAKHEVVQANTLWDLAQHYYKDPWQWPRIHEANKDQIDDPHWIYPGQVFVIPGFDTLVTVAPKEPVEEEPVEEEPIEEAPAAAPEPAPPAEDVIEDALSLEMPEGLVGQQPSMYRVRRPKDWVPDGKVLALGDRETMAAAGDQVRIRMSGGLDLGKGERLMAYRYGAPTEADKGADGKVIEGSYLTRVGVLEVSRKLPGGVYRAVVLEAGGSVQAGDVLKKE